MEEEKILSISVDDIIPNRFQPRLEFDEKALNELADSIKEHGIIQPLVVRRLGDKFEIIAGERRYKASTIAGLSQVPVIVKNITDEKSAELAVVENLQRRNLSAIEEAKSYQKLLDSNFPSQDALAKTLGVSQPTVANKLRLLGLANEVQDALLKNRISERHARSLLSLQDEEEQISLLEKIITNRMTVKQTDEAVKEILSRQRIEHLDTGQKPVEVEEIPSEEKIEDLTPINAKESTETEKPKIDLAALLRTEDSAPVEKEEKIEEIIEVPEKIEEEPKIPDRVGEEVIEEPETIEKEEDKNLDSTPPTTFSDLNSQQSSEKLNFNTQINPFQETEILDFSPTPASENTITKVEEEKEKEPLMSNKSEIKPHDLISVINATRGISKDIEQAGFIVNIEEFDFEDMYQVTIKIQK